MMPMYLSTDLPEELQDVARRIVEGDVVFGFELHLLAEYVSS